MKIIKNIDFTIANDPAACHTKWRFLNRIQTFFLYPSVHALLGHSISHFLYKLHLCFLSKMVAGFFRFLTGIEIHPGAKLGHSIFIDHGHGVVIGETAEVGNYVIMYHGVTLGGTGNHTGKRHPNIQDHVMIGTGAKILGPITIGHHSKVGANSVVLKDIEPFSVVVGIPAKVIKNDKG